MAKYHSAAEALALAEKWDRCYPGNVNVESVVDELVAALRGELAVLAMAVARLGGEVEGAPTHRGNFLQRIDALRRMEAASGH